MASESRLGEGAAAASPQAGCQPAAYEDLYELSPMQQGMLYHTITASQPGVYCNAVHYRIVGDLDAEALFEAWRIVVGRHPVLRSSFHWRGRETPVQAVHREVGLPLTTDDWRAVDPVERRTRLAALLASEHRRGFDITAVPLIRIFLIRCADDQHDLVVTHHHLLLDGSCKPLLFAELFAAYEAHRRGRPLELPPPGAYRRFIEWLHAQDLVAAERFWRGELCGFTEPTPLWPDEPPPARAASDYAEHHFQLGAAASDRLRRFARSNRITLNTAVSGAWGLLLAAASGHDDVVFGATVNARPMELEGIESMLGLFINTLPVRLRMAPAARLGDWLRDAQRRQIQAREYGFAPLPAIQRWSGVVRGRPLFESILVFENNMGFGSGPERYGSLEVAGVGAIIRNSLPLTLRCLPAADVSMELLYDAGRFAAPTVDSIARLFVRLLGGMAAADGPPIAEVLRSLGDTVREEAARRASAFREAVRERLGRRELGRRRPETSRS